MAQEDSRFAGLRASIEQYWAQYRLTGIMPLMAAFVGGSGVFLIIWLLATGPVPREAVAQSRERAQESASLIAGAIVETALKANRLQIGETKPSRRRRGRAKTENPNFKMDAARKLMQRMSASSGMRIQLYDDKAKLVLDSAMLSDTQAVVAIPLSQADDESAEDANALTEQDKRRVKILLKSALAGAEQAWAGRSRGDFAILAAEPVQRLKRIRGAVVVMRYEGSRGSVVASGFFNRLSPYIAGFVGLGVLAGLLGFGLLRPLRKAADFAGTGEHNLDALVETSADAGATLVRRGGLLDAIQAPVAAMGAGSNAAERAYVLDIIALASDIDKAAAEPKSAVDVTALLKAIEGEHSAIKGDGAKGRVRGVRVRGREAVLRPLLHFLSLSAVEMAGRSPRVHLEAKGVGEDEVHITIDDNGAAPKTADINGWFARLKDDVAPLGAQIALRGVEAHNGRISVKAHGDGARLRIALPA